MTRRALIGEGGLFRRFEARCHLTQTRTQIVVVLLFTWVPIMVSAVLTEVVTKQPVPLIHDTAVHVRLLVATPLLLFLDGVFPTSCTIVADQLVRDAFIRPDDLERYEKVVARTSRLCEWWMPEVAIAAVAFVMGSSSLFVTHPVHGVELKTGLTFSDWWYAFVGVALFEFLLYRSLWRWLIWVSFLARLSRINLDLDATHPDLRAGLAFLRQPSIAYCSLLMFALASVLSGGWSDRFQLATVTSFIPLLLILAAVAILFAFGPLLLFALQLHYARFGTRNALAGLAVRNGRWFRGRWMESAGGDAITNQDVQSLAALATTYQATVKKVHLVLFEKWDLILVLLATLIPVVPTMLLRIPAHEWYAMGSFLMSQRGIP